MTPPTPDPGPFTRATHRRVHVVDAIARSLIRLAGLGTIVAVSLVGLFLIWVVVPLFVPERIEPPRRAALSSATKADPVQICADEYLLLAWTFQADGSLRLIRLEDGRVLGQRRPFGPDAPTCWSFMPGETSFAVGFADGTVRLGTIGFATDHPDADQLPPEAENLEPGQSVAVGEVVFDRPAGKAGRREGSIRAHRLDLTTEDPVPVGDGSGIALIDLSITPGGPVLASLSDDGMLRISRIRRRKNLLTGTVTTRATGGSIRLKAPPASPPAADDRRPRWLALSGQGDSLAVIWPDGMLLRYDVHDPASPVLAERVELIDEPGVALSSVGFLTGKSTLVCGDTSGHVRAWFAARRRGVQTPDGIRLVPGHDLGTGDGSPVVDLSASDRTRILAVAHRSGLLRLIHVTSEQELGSARLASSLADPAVAIAPRDDAIVAVDLGGLALMGVDAPHPEVTLRSIWRPVWYEGYPEPERVWQSSSGSDDFESKYGLYPLVFGTLKATVYSMLFGAPLALLAAIYTSEFMHRRVAGRVKPTIELMASLPSVVLGFVAALVVAPLIEGVVFEVILLLFTVPLVLLLGGHLWRTMPRRWQMRLDRHRLVAVGAMLVGAVLIAALAGGPAETLLFGGDIRIWLAGSDGPAGGGGATGGWFLLLLPLAGLATALVVVRVVNPRIGALSVGWSSSRAAGILLVVFIAAATGAGLLAWAGASLLDGLGLDPRGSIVGTYVQRNALIVGFIMGFAIIPIIYTIAEDALSAVPEGLRAASLGAGATRWQTAVRIVVPTAMSGLFSALMVGLGRAVGETMIVLMAAGNTPVTDWNIFNGFRTLSANIAVELPEAVRNSTHFRMLFLAALVLFALTFVINTAAEVVRLRFRKRAYEL